jgi:hypothetical protein
MKSPDRDLLVLLKDETMSEHAIEQEVERINSMLVNIESSDSFYSSHELLDLNKFKLVRDRKAISQICNDKQMKAFTFLCNLN